MAAAVAALTVAVVVALETAVEAGAVAVGAVATVAAVEAIAVLALGAAAGVSALVVEGSERKTRPRVHLTQFRRRTNCPILVQPYSSNGNMWPVNRRYFDCSSTMDKP